MVEGKGAQISHIAPMFLEWDKELIHAGLEGGMGRVWADRLPNPTAARLIVGDFCFLAGDAFASGAADLTAQIPPEFSSDTILMVPQKDAWSHLIERTFPGRFVKLTRFSFLRDDTGFDRTRLQSFVDALPPNYQLRQIEESLYPAVMSQAWSRDLCAQFASGADFCARGLGVAALKENEVVGGASSYVVSSSGIEIEVDVREDCRRQGIARACAAKLMLLCLARGIYPGWDAANPASKALALSLGYQFDKPYLTYAVAGNKHPRIE